MNIKKIIGLTGMIFAAALTAVSANPVAVDGYYSAGFENVQNPGQNSLFLQQYLNLNAGNLFMPELSFFGYGRMKTAINNDNSDGDLYLGYLQYRTFQGVTDIMLGRFNTITNRFMTLDGIQMTQITPWNFGVTGYVGNPRYMDDNNTKDKFRITGDLAYGGKIFLSGVESVQLNINYYRETGFDDYDRYTVYKETAGAGGAFYNSFSNGKGGYSAEALLDQDVNNGILARMSAKMSATYGKVQAGIFGDYFDVRDNYPAGRELIIRLISTGKESRYGVVADYDITDRVNVYAGATLTDVQMRSGENNEGKIYRVGTNLVFVKDLGLSASLELYDYESVVQNATGVSGSFDWQMTEDFSLFVAAEQAWLRDSSNDGTASSFESRFSVYLTEELIMAIFGQIGSNNRFVDDYRWGAQLKYAF